MWSRCCSYLNSEQRTLALFTSFRCGQLRAKSHVVFLAAAESAFAVGSERSDRRRYAQYRGGMRNTETINRPTGEMANEDISLPDLAQRALVGIARIASR